MHIFLSICICCVSVNGQTDNPRVEYGNQTELQKEQNRQMGFDVLRYDGLRLIRVVDGNTSIVVDVNTNGQIVRPDSIPMKYEDGNGMYLSPDGKTIIKKPIEKLLPLLPSKTPEQLAEMKQKVVIFRLEQATNGNKSYQFMVSSNYLMGTDGFPINTNLSKYWYNRAKRIE